MHEPSFAVASDAHRPVFNHDFRHGEVANVAGREPGTDAVGCRRDQAIRLMQRDAVRSECPPPGASTRSFS